MNYVQINNNELYAYMSIHVVLACNPNAFFVYHHAFFVYCSDILNLVKGSMVPFVLAELMGGKPDMYRDQITAGQIALRFPGDMCPGVC